MQSRLVGLRAFLLNIQPQQMIRASQPSTMSIQSLFSPQWSHTMGEGGPWLRLFEVISSRGHQHLMDLQLWFIVEFYLTG